MLYQLSDIAALAVAATLYANRIHFLCAWEVTKYRGKRSSKTPLFRPQVKVVKMDQKLVGKNGQKPGEFVVRMLNKHI